MPITKEVVTDKIEVLETGVIQVRTATRIVEDGKVLAETYHRETIAPGDDVTGKPARVADVARAVHKPEVVADYRAKMAARAQKETG